MKKKIHNYDFLIVGAGLIGSLAALHLIKNKYKVLVIDKGFNNPNDNRTLAVNANSKDFLTNLGLWDQLSSKPEDIKKIEISDNINNDPLIFENLDENMGNVILNKELLLLARSELLKKKSLIFEVNISIDDIAPQKIIDIKNKEYVFNGIILSLGKNYTNNAIIKKISIPSSHKAYVGFFFHSKNHNQKAYEIFTSNGPLAALPSPYKNKKKSTFIYSSRENISNLKIKKLLKKYFSSSHGLIKLEDKYHQYQISPHVSRDKSNKYFLIGDSLRSIHPVAGQGWNLGIKDIQSLTKIIYLNDLSDTNLIKKYYNERAIENSAYIAFTSIINLLYENQNIFNNSIIRLGFKIFKRSNYLRTKFIKQAMGRLNLI